MSGDRHGTGIVPDALGCAIAAAAVASATALAVAVTGVSDDARRALGFGFGGVERSPSEAARIALHNARFVAGTLVCAGVIPRLGRRARVTVDALLASLLVVNAGAVGIAAGSYGSRLLAATAAHMALELTAFVLAGGAYMQARKHAVSAWTLGTVTAACAVLLGIAATLETYVSTNGGAR